MQADSKPVSSNQPHIHRKLPAVVRRHLANPSRKPVAEHSRRAFDLLLAKLAADPRPLVIDSFCGTGHSTGIIAQRHSDHLIVGIDKSSHRLAKHEAEITGGYLLLHAECEDIWQLLLQEQIFPDHHYLFYPNPWPKSAHLQRRIHGSAAFRTLLALGGQVELRSNWQIYVEEFGVAMSLAGSPGIVSQLEPEQPITLFERKYQASGHSLWRFLGAVNKPFPLP